MVNLLHKRAVSLRSQVTETNEDDLKKATDGVNKATQALIEMCGGNFNNQRVIVNTQVMDGINVILKTATPINLQVSVESIYFDTYPVVCLTDVAGYDGQG